MRRIPRHLRWTALAGAFVLLAGAACGSDHKKSSSANSTSTAAGTVKDGGQIVFGADQEPTGFEAPLTALELHQPTTSKSTVVTDSTTRP